MFAFIYKIGSCSVSARWLLNGCHHATKSWSNVVICVYSFAVRWYYKKRRKSYKIIEDT